MDQTSAPGGFLGGFVLAGILLPIVGSFILDGIVLYFRGRSPRLLLIASTFTIAIVLLFAAAWQNGVSTSEGSTVTGDTMSGAIGLILMFSVPAALIGFGVRMLALFLNPRTRDADHALIAARARRRAHRAVRRSHCAVTVARHA
jgi:hypothetical protein